MFVVEFFNQYGEYEKKTFNDRNKFIKFLEKCQKDDLQVLNFTDHYIED